VALVDMSLAQLAEAYNGLDRLEGEYENLSGICATLKGLVLLQVKANGEHGTYRKWLKENFPKSIKTAERYVRLAKAFSKSDSTVAFQSLTRDLAESVAALREFQLDLKHPVVAKIAAWVGGRGSYQLMLDFPSTTGGNQYERNGTKGKRTRLGQRELLALMRKNVCNTATELGGIARTESFRCLNDAELDLLIEEADTVAVKARAWRRKSKTDRDEILRAELAKQMKKQGA
jgi:hypothetical protein